LRDIRWKDLGQHVAAMMPIARDEEIIKAIPVKEFNEHEFLVFFTKQGMVKKSSMDLYKAQRYSRPLVAINLKGDDQVVDVHLTDGSKEIFIATHIGYGLWFSEDEVNQVGAR